MARDDWFRNTTWNEDIAAAFQARLKRAGDKTQCLRVQASYLTRSHPQVALDLIDQYFSYDDKSFDAAWALVFRAQALTVLGDVDGAIATYEGSLEQEHQVPNVQSPAWLDLPCLIVEARVERLYPRAVELLVSYEDRVTTFPLAETVYRARGAHALLLHHFGQDQDARDLAAEAMDAARRKHSGYRYHPRMGLVASIDDDFGRRVAALAGGARSRQPFSIRRMLFGR